MIDNNMMIEFERLVVLKAEESVGSQMLYDVCEHLREIISNLNDKLLNKLKEYEDAHSVDKALQKQTFSQDAPMTFTPVTAETFGAWLAEYNERRRRMKEELKTELESKPTGREIFMTKKLLVEEINIDDEGDEEYKEDGEDDDEEDYQYDQALYVRED